MLLATSSHLPFLIAFQIQAMNRQINSPAPAKIYVMIAIIRASLRVAGGQEPDVWRNAKSLRSIRRRNLTSQFNVVGNGAGPPLAGGQVEWFSRRDSRSSH